MIKIWQENKQDKDVYLRLIEEGNCIFLAVIDPKTGRKLERGNLLCIHKYTLEIVRTDCVSFPNNPFKLESNGKVIIE